MIRPRLENWGIVPLTDLNPYQAPEAQAKGITGEVYGHPNSAFADGQTITTSTIQKAWIEGTDIVVQTVNREYLLGTVNPVYEAMYPNARQRIVNQLKKG